MSPARANPVVSVSLYVLAAALFAFIYVYVHADAGFIGLVLLLLGPVLLIIAEAISRLTAL